MTYIQGFLVPVPEGNKQVYREMAASAVPVFEKHGMVRMVECWSDDVPHGETTDMYRGVNAEKGEIVVFSWVDWGSKETWQKAHKAFAEDEEMEAPAEMPFDGKRMVYAEFDMLGEAGEGGDTRYVNGYVAPVPRTNKEAFAEMCAAMREMAIEVGALRAVDSYAASLADGKVTDFKRAVKAENGEGVAFGFTEWASKEACEQGMAKMREDSRMPPPGSDMPVDGKRLIFGGFEVLLDTAGARMMAGEPVNTIWYELMTPDPDAAARFYGDLVGWEIGGGAPGGDMDYRMIAAPGGHVGGVFGLSGEMIAGGARPAWLGYIAVDDVDAMVADIEGAGGSELMPARDVPPAGRIVMVADPQGIPFYIMRPTPPEDAPDSQSTAFSVTDAGHCRWNELITPDLDGALDFYCGRFGWDKGDAMDMGEMGPYQFIDHGGTMIGAMMQQRPGEPGTWTYYFGVEDIDAAAEAIEAGGGTVTYGPEEIPGGEFALNAIDPQGAAFGLVGAKEQAS